MSLTILESHSSCTKCDLASCAESPGMATVPFTHGRPSVANQGSHDQALLIIGEKPGVIEDQEGLPFIGTSGRKLDIDYIHGLELQNHVDIYLGNAVRCKPPRDSSPTIGQLRTCLPWLTSDITRLSNSYRRVIILSVSSPATRTLTESLAKSVDPTRKNGYSNAEYFTRQGLELPEYPNVTLFATHHPAYVLRDPAHERAVLNHLLAVREFIVHGEILQEDQPSHTLNPPLEPMLDGLLAFDLETDGCLIEGKQTTFHPIKMNIRDGIPYEEQIVCASTCWRDKLGEIKTGIFLNTPIHMANLEKWLLAARILGTQNGQYDIKLIRACLGKPIILLYKRIRELMVDTFLFDDVMERGLKSTSWLYRISDYKDDPKPVHVYPNMYSKELHHYAAKDAWTTYRGLEIAHDWTSERYGSHPIASSKLSSYAQSWYSAQLWTAIQMEERGVPFDIDLLEAEHSRTRARLHEIELAAHKLSPKVLVNDRLASAIQEFGCDNLGPEVEWLDYILSRSKYTLPQLTRRVAASKEIPNPDFLLLKGEGSKKSLDLLIQDVIAWLTNVYSRTLPEPQADALLDTLARLERTDKREELKADANNRNVLAGLLPLNNSDASLLSAKLALVAEHRSLSKIVDSYTNPLLIGRSPVEHWQYNEVPTKPGAKNPTRKVKIPGTCKLTYNESHSLIRKLTKSGRRLGMAYPNWYIIPKSRDDSGPAGGTRQYRWSAKDPAIQVLPKTLKRTLTTAYSPGVLFSYDYAQIEWRMAAWLSGDPVMLEEISNDLDIHIRTASMLLGPRLTETAEWITSRAAQRFLLSAPDVEMRRTADAHYNGGILEHPYEEKILTFVQWVQKWFRQNGGKSQNYAELYGGTSGVIQATTRIKCGIEVPRDTVDSWYDWTQSHYERRTSWRSEILDQVRRDGALHLPILGQSRTFSGISRDESALDTAIDLYRPKILDFPIQCQSGNILQAAVMEAQRQFRKRRLRAWVIANNHDSMIVDAHSSDYLEADLIVRSAMTSTVYLRKLTVLVGRPPIFDFDGGPIARYPANLELPSLLPLEEPCHV